LITCCKHEGKRDVVIIFSYTLLPYFLKINGIKHPGYNLELRKSESNDPRILLEK
jgi:hypothetical protein